MPDTYRGLHLMVQEAYYHLLHVLLPTLVPQRMELMPMSVACPQVC